MDLEKLVNQTESILNTPLIDYAKSVDIFINGEDEETAEMAIKKLYGLD